MLLWPRVLPPRAAAALLHFKWSEETACVHTCRTHSSGNAHTAEPGPGGPAGRHHRRSEGCAVSRQLRRGELRRAAAPGL